MTTTKDITTVPVKVAIPTVITADPAEHTTPTGHVTNPAEFDAEMMMVEADVIRLLVRVRAYVVAATKAWLVMTPALSLSVAAPLEPLPVAVAVPDPTTAPRLARAAVAVVAPVPPDATAKVPPRVMLGVVDGFEVVNERPVDPPDVVTIVTVPVPSVVTSGV